MDEECRSSGEAQAAGESSPAGRLSQSEGIEIAGRVADIVRAGLPLASGLRALGEELPSRRIRRVLNRISRRLEAGDSLEEVLSQHGRALPRPVSRMMQAGLPADKLATLMVQYLNYARGTLDVMRRMWLGLAYPVVLVMAAAAVCSFLLQWIVPRFKKIFEDFGTELPAITVLLINISDGVLWLGFWVFLVPLVVAFFCWHGVAFFGGRALRRRIVNSIPVFGSMLQYSSLSRFCHLLAILVEFEIRLPDALRTAGEGCDDANIREGSRLTADKVEAGESLVEAASATPHFPPEVLNLFRWEGRKDAFHDALEGAAEVFAARARTQCGLIPVLVEPIVLVTVAVTVGGIVLALFMPLIKLVNDLS